jgi:hypothetical protein
MHGIAYDRIWYDRILLPQLLLLHLLLLYESGDVIPPRSEENQSMFVLHQR